MTLEELNQALATKEQKIIDLQAYVKELKATKDKKRIKELERQLEHEKGLSAYLKLEIRQRTKSFMTQMQVFEGIFKAALDSAGTIGEARTWFKQWAEDVNALDIDDPNHQKNIAKLIADHGFEFEIKDHGEEVDAMWEESRGAA